MNAKHRIVCCLIGIGVLACASRAEAQIFFGKDPANSLTRNNPAFLKVFKDVVAKPGQSTVRIQCDGKDTALGMIIGPDGWILTKANDLKGEIIVKLRDGKAYEARLVGVHPKHDVALLKIEASGLQPVDFTDSKLVGVGNWVACAGMGEEPVAVGVVSTPVSPNVSFFPLVDLSKSGYLGIQLEPGEGHPRVQDIMPNTPAAKIGLKKMDLLLTINGAEMKEIEQFQKEVAKFKPDEVITLKVRRAGVEMELKPKLERRPADSNRGDIQNRMGSELSSKRGGYATILQHDSVVRPIDCGGPIVDLQGRVVGINICRAGRVESWAIPSEAIQPILFDLMAGKLTPKQEVAKLSVEQQLAATRKALKKAEDEKARSETKLAELKTIVAKLESDVKIAAAKEAEAKAQAAAKTTPAVTTPPSAVKTDDAAAVADKLVNLMQARLKLMKDVAGAKWQAKQTDADPKREKELLDQLVVQGQKMGVPAETVRVFFAAQFDAAKQVQQTHFDRFQKDKVELKNVPDLQKDLRPKLDQVSQELLTALSQLQPHLGTPAVQKRLQERAAAILTGDGISEAVRSRALEPLVKR